jgi:hypothetical protein
MHIVYALPHHAAHKVHETKLDSDNAKPVVKKPVLVAAKK